MDFERWGILPISLTSPLIQRFLSINPAIIDGHLNHVHDNILSVRKKPYPCHSDENQNPEGWGGSGFRLGGRNDSDMERWLERLKASDSKSDEHASVPWVQITPSPHFLNPLLAGFCFD